MYHAWPLFTAALTITLEEAVMNRLRPLALVLTACITLFASATPVSAESAQEIFKAAGERYEKQLSSIESITIVQDVMGMEVTTRLVKEMVDDRPVLVPSNVGRSGDFNEMYRHFDEMAKHASVKGSEDVDGHSCWVVHVEEIEGVRFDEKSAGKFETSDGTMYFDKKEYVMRRMVVNGEAMRDGEKKPVSMEMSLMDYREVDGWMHPFKTEMRLTGEGGVSSADMAEMKKAMEQMEEQLKQMPAEQREMVEKMMKSKMPQMTEGADGGLTVTVTVKELRVNEPAE